MRRILVGMAAAVGLVGGSYLLVAVTPRGPTTASAVAPALAYSPSPRPADANSLAPAHACRQPHVAQPTSNGEFRV